MAKVIRFKPRTRGAKRRYTLTKFGVRIQEERGWHQVDDEVATYLDSVEDANGARMFEVYTPDEARAIDRKEMEARARDGRPALPGAEFGSPRDITASGVAQRRASSPGRGKRGAKVAAAPDAGTGDLTTDDLKTGTSREKPKPQATGGRSMRAARTNEA